MDARAHAKKDGQIQAETTRGLPHAESTCTCARTMRMYLRCYTCPRRSPCTRRPLITETGHPCQHQQSAGDCQQGERYREQRESEKESERKRRTYVCLCVCMHVFAYMKHTYMYIYIYQFICIICVCTYISSSCTCRAPLMQLQTSGVLF